MFQPLLRFLGHRPATAPRSGPRRCIPRLEPLDGRLLPGGSPGGVLKAGDGFYTGGAAVAGHTANPPVTPEGGASGGVLKGDGAAVGSHLTMVEISRSGGEEIPQ